MLDHRLIGSIRIELERNGWRNKRNGDGGPVFVIDKLHRRGDATQRNVTWALSQIDEWARARADGRPARIIPEPATMRRPGEGRGGR